MGLKPDHPEALGNLGATRQLQGRLNDAVLCYQRALDLKPDSVEALGNLGCAFQLLGKLDEAVACQERALALRPNCAEAWFNLGNTRKEQGNLDEAVACFERGMVIKPNHVDAFYNLGNTLQEQGKLDEAVSCYDRALALKPDHAEAHGNLGNTLHAQGKLNEAVSHHRRALELKPEIPESHYNLGNALQDQDKLDDAIACYERALTLKPDYAKAHHNLGCARLTSGSLDDGLVLYRRALALQPDFALARFSESLAQLSMGDLASGWGNYESRWKTKEHVTRMREYAQPFWTGEKLTSGRVLIWGEQGVGDEIMFAGLLPDVIRTGNVCILDCDARLKPLFTRSFPTTEVISTHDQGHDSEPNFAAHLPCGSLPRLFRQTEADFASKRTPYLFADAVARKQFRDRYSDGRRLIGLAWHTNNRKTGRRRSMNLSLFAPLLAQPNIQWVSLQYGDHTELETQAAIAGVPILVDRTVNQFSNIDLFAAQIAAMDMVVTIDNSTAHLAGALGVPTWVLLPFSPDWRWLQTREDSPWYPTMRLFRQPKIGDWQSVIRGVHSAL